mmetsp:Transcript_17016/g.42623  ORF Transcript_17016/g.42623 Transcript_17016/m.42623 type:complete len:214 (-) Transcript_17016:58-699(-)
MTAVPSSACFTSRCTPSAFSARLYTRLSSCAPMCVFWPLSLNSNAYSRSRLLRLAPAPDSLRIMLDTKSLLPVFRRSSGARSTSCSATSGTPARPAAATSCSTVCPYPSAPQSHSCASRTAASPRSSASAASASCGRSTRLSSFSQPSLLMTVPFCCACSSRACAVVNVSTAAPDAGGAAPAPAGLPAGLLGLLPSPLPYPLPPPLLLLLVLP